MLSLVINFIVFSWIMLIWDKYDNLRAQVATVKWQLWLRMIIQLAVAPQISVIAVDYWVT